MRLRAQFSPFSNLGHLWVYVLIALLFAAVVVQPIYQPDFWWHVKVGEVVLHQGAVPQVDLFSHTVAGRSFIYQSWLAGVLLALLYRAGGAGLVILSNALLFAAAYALLLWHCRQEGGNTRLAVGVTLAALVVSSGNWAVRPQTFSVLLFVALYTVVDRYRQGKKSPLWVLPLLMALWANLHGAFVTGLAVLGLTVAGEVVKRWLPGRPCAVLPWSRIGRLVLITAASAAAILVNPVGLRILDYLTGIWGNPAIRSFITEWRAVGSEAGTGAIFLLTLLGYPLALYLRRRTLDPTDLLLLLAMAWLSLGAVRNLLWYGLVLAPLLARALAREEGPEPRPSRGLHLALAGLVTLIAVLALPWVKGALPLPDNLQDLYSQDTPRVTAEFVSRQGLPGPLLNQMESGGYLMWRLYPNYAVFIDARIELYPGDIWQDYFHISAGRPGYQELLDRYGIRLLLLNRRHQGGLARAVQDTAQWEWVYENAQEDTVVYRRCP